MSDEVLDRLREMFGVDAADAEGVFTAVEAYDRHTQRTLFAQRAEIERLRAALREIAEYGGGDGGDWVACCDIASAALVAEGTET